MKEKMKEGMLKQMRTVMLMLQQLLTEMLR